MFYVIVADDRLCGVYRTAGAAKRRMVELAEYPINFHQGPEMFCSDNLPAWGASVNLEARASARAEAGYFGKMD